MCPYCQKRFKSKATCRIHLQIHKTEWVKQFKEQIKSGTIQFEEDSPNETNDQVVLDTITSSTNEGLQLQTLNETNTASHDETVPIIPESSQVLFTNLVQETQIDESRNRFEYFLLLPTNADPNNVRIDGDVRSEAEQFIVNDEQLSFTNLQFIQLDQSALLDMQNSQAIPLATNYQLNDSQSIEGQLSQLEHQTMDSRVDCVSNMSNVTESNETAINATPTTESNALSNKTSTNSRSRKSTKSVNKCDTCSKIFQKPIDLRRHIRTHTLEKVIVKEIRLSISTN